MTRQHAMSIPGNPKSGPSFATSCRHKVPRNVNAQATARHLSDLFRAGDIYAYAYEDSQWWTWRTQADWDATERTGDNGRTVRDPAARAAGHGPTVFDPANTPCERCGFRRDSRECKAIHNVKRPTKAEAISLLRAIAEGTDWQVSDLENLLAREAA